MNQVHAIFGAFLAGIIVPREGGLAIALTEKLEDMVSIIFLPLVSPILQPCDVYSLRTCSTSHCLVCLLTWASSTMVCTDRL